MSRGASTLIGAIAILLWSFLALFATASGDIPPFQLNAMAFAVGTVVGIVNLLRTPGAVKNLRQPAKAWALGIAGLFGYHFFYFTALRNAPTVDASLIAYLWPLLIVLFSALLPGEKLKWQHIAGCILGLGGAALIVMGGEGFSFKTEYAVGYFFAILSALTWSTYSVVSRRFADVPTDTVTGILRRNGHLVARWPPFMGNDRLARGPVAMVSRHRFGTGAAWPCLLCLGSRRKAWRHPNLGRGVLLSAAAIHNHFDRLWLW